MKVIYAKTINPDYMWKIVTVLEYDKYTEVFKCCLKDTDIYIDLHRIMFCIEAEDPKKYSMRVINALEKRKRCLTSLRYNFIIDNMKTFFHFFLFKRKKKEFYIWFLKQEWS